MELNMSLTVVKSPPLLERLAAEAETFRMKRLEQARKEHERRERERNEAPKVTVRAYLTENAEALHRDEVLLLQAWLEIGYVERPTVKTVESIKAADRTMLQHTFKLGSIEENATGAAQHFGRPERWVYSTLIKAGVQVRQMNTGHGLYAGDPTYTRRPRAES